MENFGNGTGRVKRTSWGALGLVVNALILWTTRYMNAALNHLHATGADVKKEDLARLSPLGHKHFNVLGRYHFTVPEEVLRGDLRAAPHARGNRRRPTDRLAQLFVPFY